MALPKCDCSTCQPYYVLNIVDIFKFLFKIGNSKVHVYMVTSATK